MTLDALIDTVRTHVAALPGLARTYDDPPESMQEFPCAIVYAARGEYEFGAVGRSFHTVIVEIHHNRQVLPEAMDAAKVWPDRLYTELAAADDIYIYDRMRYVCGGLPYGRAGGTEETHYGVRFEIPCKVMQ